MIKVKDFFKILAYGEISSVYIGGSGSGEIPEDRKSNLIEIIQLGLNDLCSKFPFIEKEVIVRMHEDIAHYYLEKRYALSSPEPVYKKYIIDSKVDPFMEDVIRINKASNEVGNNIYLNDQGINCSVKLLGYNGIQVTNPVDGNHIFLTYIANHPKLTSEEDMIRLPSYALDALHLFVASRVYSRMHNQIQMAKSQELILRYDAQIEKITEHNLSNTHTGHTNNKLDMRGFV